MQNLLLVLKSGVDIDIGIGPLPNLSDCLGKIIADALAPSVY